MAPLARSAFQSHVDGGPTDLYTLQGSSGLQVAICNDGARLVRVAVPDGQAERIDMALGYDCLMLNPGKSGLRTGPWAGWPVEQGGTTTQRTRS